MEENLNGLSRLLKSSFPEMENQNQQNILSMNVDQISSVLSTIHYFSYLSTKAKAFKQASGRDDKLRNC